MRWWLRFVVTLVLAPLLWWLAVAYLQSQQGAAWSDLFAQIGRVLESVYLVFTLPALGLCILLAIVDLILHRLGIDLLTVLLSPCLGWGIAEAIVTFVHEPHVQAATGAVPLAIVYGLVWGLTIREPRQRRVVRPKPVGRADVTA